MRIAIIHWTCRKVAGAESYTESILSALASRGHMLGLWHETDRPETVRPISLPDQIVQWSAKTLGSAPALDELLSWQPDVLFAQGLGDPHLEERVLDLRVPAIFFSHNYYGTCISGKKSFAVPQHTPCARRFGVACLAHYYPRRCGGLNPVTMWRNYAAQATRLALLKKYRRLLVASEHMVSEYARHQLKAEAIPLWADDEPRSVPAPGPSLDVEIHLLFIGRLETTKGGQILIDALSAVARALGRPLTCHFAGTGQARSAWERRAARTSAPDADIQVIFHGWLDDEDLTALLRRVHLLVLPSVWPEPFGLVGLEAGRMGVPTVAFAVGGIPQWLESGVNGVLADGSAPSASALAKAIVEALIDPARYQRLRRGASTVSHEKFSREKHVSQLERILSEAAQMMPPGNSILPS